MREPINQKANTMDQKEKVETRPNEPIKDDLEDRRKVLDELHYREHNKAQQQTNRRILFIISLALIIVGIFFWAQTTFVTELFIYGNFSEKDPSDLRVASTVKLFGSFFILFSTVIFSYLYMAGFDPRKQRQSKTDDSTEALRTDDGITLIALLRSIDRSIEKGKLESVLSSEEREAVISKISETVESQLNDSLLSRIEEKYGLAIQNQKLSETAKKSLDSTVVRLKSYADKLQEKASVNLAWGIASTLTAILILSFVLINASPPQEATQIVIVFYYTSRVLLVLLVQGISIFFLNLYKATLNNIMYINNEITNYEAKRDALVLSLNSGNIESSHSILLSLALTERNFALKKGETSIFTSMEGSQAEVQNPSAVIQEMLSKVLNKKD